MSADELFVLLISAILALLSWGNWVYVHNGVGDPDYPHGRGALPYIIPLACAGILFSVLRSAASFDVRDSTLYTVFYMMLGLAWIGLTARASAFMGISARDDAVERSNGAASIAIAGAMLGVTFAFAGGNVGDGPGWWVVVFAAALATAALFALWWALDLVAHVGDAITIDRDDATALRLAGFLVGQGIILGRSVAGDWVSSADTVRDFYIAGWPALLLLGFAILVERSFRVSPQRPRPSVLSHGFLPALAYVIGAVSYVLWLEAHP